MEVTGWDTVIFTFTPPRDVFARVLAFTASRWPSAIFEGIMESRMSPGVIAGFPAEKLPSGPGWLIFNRDAEMAHHLAQFAYEPMADGDGPFAVITRVRESVEFEVSGLDEVRAADHKLLGPRPPEPYCAWLCTPLVIDVTTVTPGDPATHPFSSWILAEVKRACGE